MEIVPSLHETEFKNCFGIYSKNQNLKFDKKFYDKLVELNFYVKEINEDEKLSRNLKNDSISFNLVTSFNNHSYLLNPKIYDYLFDEIEFHISASLQSEIDYFNEEIKLKLNCFKDIIKKNEFLVSLKLKLTDSIDNCIDYINYKGNNSTNTMNFGSWKEYVKYTLSYEEKIILDFLYGNEINISRFEIWKDWEKNYLIDIKIKVIDQKLDEINFKKLKSKHKLFKDNAEAFIEYIVNKSDKKLNTGFYTCLYYFLKEERIINSFNQTNDTEFCSYIKEKYLNNSTLKFSRLNQVDRDNKSSKYSKTLEYFKEEYSNFLNKI